MTASRPDNLTGSALYRAVIGHCLTRKLPRSREDWLAAQINGFSEANWQEAVAEADAAALLPTWFAALRTRGLSAHVPEPLRDAMAASLLLNRERNAHLRAQAQDLSACLAGIDCPAVYLKGMGHILDGTYADRGARLTSDIDVLVPRARIEEAGRQMFAHGYRIEAAPEVRDLTVSRFNHHLAPMRREGELAGTELHYAFLSHRAEPVEAADILAAAVRPDENSPVMVPCPTHAAAIAVMHATLRPALMQGHHLKMRDILDFVAVSEKGRVDSELLVQGFRAVGAEAHLGGFLHAVEAVTGFEMARLGLEDLASRHAGLGARMLAGRERMTAMAPLYYDAPGPLRWGLSLLTSRDFRRHVLSLVTDREYRRQRRAYLAAERDEQA